MEGLPGMKLPDGHPMLVAWDAYRGSEGYATIQRQLALPRGTDVMAWHAFMSGWMALKEHSEKLCNARIEDLRQYPHSSWRRWARGGLREAVEFIRKASA